MILLFRYFCFWIPPSLHSSRKGVSRHNCIKAKICLPGGDGSWVLQTPGLCERSPPDIHRTWHSYFRRAQQDCSSHLAGSRARPSSHSCLGKNPEGQRRVRGSRGESRRRRRSDDLQVERRKNLTVSERERLWTDDMHKKQTKLNVNIKMYKMWKML